jgi:D-alanyl-D-alanine endopeptidase (penicillin-binding protein 7)
LPVKLAGRRFFSTAVVALVVSSSPAWAVDPMVGEDMNVVEQQRVHHAADVFEFDLTPQIDAPDHLVQPLPTSAEDPNLSVAETPHELVRAAGALALRSNAALIVDQDSGEPLLMKNADEVRPIASLTKLMTALVVIDAKLPMDEVLEVTSEDIDTERHTRSRLAVGTRLTRGDLLLLALMASENRAARALSRNYPGGRAAFVNQMNVKAQSLGMRSTHFSDPAGLSNGSVSTARDLQRLVTAAYAQPLIRNDTTQPESQFRVKRRVLSFHSTNSLVRRTSSNWDIGLQKTGFTNEAGRCLVMEVTVLGHPLEMIFLDSYGKMTRYADAARVRHWLELHTTALRGHTTSAAAAP